MITALLLSPALDSTHLVDRLEPGTIHRPRTVLHRAGGKALNLARAAAVLGVRVRVVAPLGGGIGALVRDLAAAEGLELESVPIAGVTRVCVTIVDESDGGHTELYEPAPPLDDAESAAVAAALEAAPAGGWTAFSGSGPRGVDADDVVRMLSRRRDAGDRLAIDTSGAMLERLLDAAPDLVKVNRAEAAAILGAGDAATLASALAARTGGVAVVTDGTAGSAAAGPDGAFRVLPSAAPGRYPVGSGDSFLAGLLVALDRGDRLEDALHLAASAAAANTRAPGGAGFSLEDVESAGAGTVVERVP